MGRVPNDAMNDGWTYHMLPSNMSMHELDQGMDHVPVHVERWTSTQGRTRRRDVNDRLDAVNASRASEGGGSVNVPRVTIGGTNNSDISRVSNGGKNQAMDVPGANNVGGDVPEVFISGSILQAATKKHSTVMTVIFAHFIY